MAASTRFAQFDLENDGTPLWFKPDKFLDPNFNPEAYVNDLKRYVPLDELRQQLTTHANTLRAKLVEVVNDDYDEFVSLSTKLVDVDSAVATLQQPLVDIRKRVEAARAVVADQVASLQDGLARRQTVAAARGLLELAQDAVHVMTKVEKLLADLPTGNSNTTSNTTASQITTEAEQEELENRSRLLDRLCSEVSRLSFYSQRGDDLTIIRHMQPRIAKAKSMLQDATNTTLRSVLIAQNPTALPVLLHAYSSLGVSDAAEVVVRDVIIAPIIESAVSKTIINNNSNNDGNDDGLMTTTSNGNDTMNTTVNLHSLLSSILDELQSQAGPFLDLTLTPAGGSTHFDILGGSVLPEVISTIDYNCPGVYSPGFPDSFHTNYTAMMEFLHNIEALCKNVSQIERIRASSAYNDIKRKWNLIAYFSLRFQDIASAVEDVIMLGSEEDNDDNAVLVVDNTSGDNITTNTNINMNELKWKVSVAVWTALQSSVDKRIFLRPLSDRFLRLALQIVSRYSTWIQDMLITSNSISSSDGDDTSTNTTTTNNTTTNKRKSTVEELIALWHDVATIQNSIHTTITPSFQSLISSSSGGNSNTTNTTNTTTQPVPSQEAILSAFIDCDNQLQSASNTIINAIARDISDRCCDSLKQLRGIVATFRMTARSVPTRPAQYAVAILTPLETLLKTTAVGMNDDAKRGIVVAVAEEVSKRYKQVAYDTLSTVRKTESSLRRLKSRKAGDEKTSTVSGGIGGNSEQLETDKLIELQLGLDVEEFGKRIASLGIEPMTDVAEYVELKNVVVVVDDANASTVE